MAGAPLIKEYADDFRYSNETIMEISPSKHKVFTKLSEGAVESEMSIAILGNLDFDRLIYDLYANRICP